ncbi:STAS domain-containing protein [Marinobacter confluentis]|uniref:STAS domain-containing protein n=1 Tax=Marinobacter confluentis TaxID=1697557 RepID=A0A4Z1BS12_9GAMM|nr:STAS domain-containing protein [Marinobacter confluentis]TGN39999.1 STAS domain-containing protein [Marinobacter confluentis]
MSQPPRLELEGDCLKLSGDIGPANVGGIRSEGERLIAGLDQDITVDLSRLGAAHSVVLSLLLCWARLARSRNQVLRVEGAGERLRSLAALSGLDEHLPGLSHS